MNENCLSKTKTAHPHFTLGNQKKEEAIPADSIFSWLQLSTCLIVMAGTFHTFYSTLEKNWLLEPLAWVKACQGLFVLLAMI